MSKLSYEQLEAACFLAASDLAFVSFEGQGPFLGPAGDAVISNAAYCTYETSVNLNDTFYFACADAETIPWDEVVGIVAELKKLKTGDDQNMYLVDWSAKKRGHDPNIPEVAAKLAKWRKRWAESNEG